MSWTFLQWFFRYWPRNFVCSLFIIKSVFYLIISTSNVLFECVMIRMPVSKILGNRHIFLTDGDRGLLQMYISIKTNPSILFSSNFHTENIMDESIEQRVSDYLKLKFKVHLQWWYKNDCFIISNQFYFLWWKKCQQQISNLKSICNWLDF